ncbi:MAG: hypothetical protein AVDCRST_MAG93-2161 [uncultured Chloroflexia bacterium]|uniref:Uncharacterized protein n=1 Tax=uncultured Chloroflexia bacterium TaxID=1672391 RepID=A0A6J4IUQ5_9CHLR|nr:MAG: hypothetical protein AVDCRST_MAG93-2161 [uncultured Chloroflexia bacterium]
MLVVWRLSLLALVSLGALCDNTLAMNPLHITSVNDPATPVQRQVSTS